MKILLFGGTGMVGQGVLRECLLCDEVKAVLSIVRKPSGKEQPKLQQVAHSNFEDFTALGDVLDDVDACFYCLGVTSAGMNEADYDRVTRGFTVAAAKALLERSPNAAFVFVSGASSDGTEKGPVMWARVKGKAENAVLKLPFRRTVVFRPGVIQPLHGIRSRTGLYNALYLVFWPLFPLMRLVAPRYLLTTEQIGRAMLVAAKEPGGNAVLEAAAIGDYASRYEKLF